MAAADDRWLLPEGIEEVLPPQATKLEGLRRRLLDLYAVWGYQLVVPPFVEFLESLLTGTANDLDLQTFKVTDQLSGRLMGIRADMTPQVARIEAHHHAREEPTRLCYAGTILHTRSDGFAGSRCPMQVGCELYGHSGFESDLEVLGLMLESVVVAGIDNLHLDLGHVGIFRGLARRAGLEADQENELFGALQRKASAEIGRLIGSWHIQERDAERLIRLADLHGGEEVLGAAGRLFAGDPDTEQHLERLHQVSAGAQRRFGKLHLHFDLAELRGYRYHTGLVFSAYTPGSGKAVARGGRYDDVGLVFGRSRPATGFSADLKTLLALGSVPEAGDNGPVFAPRSDDPALEALVRALRGNGEQVIGELPGQSGGARELGCTRWLVEREDGWTVEPVPDAAANSYRGGHGE